ncbi:uncharacterized protein LOC144824915 [Lissotriton helveticus]
MCSVHTVSSLQTCSKRPNNPQKSRKNRESRRGRRRKKIHSHVLKFVISESRKRNCGTEDVKTYDKKRMSLIPLQSPGGSSGRFGPTKNLTAINFFHSSCYTMDVHFWEHYISSLDI